MVAMYASHHSHTPTIGVGTIFKSVAVEQPTEMDESSRTPSGLIDPDEIVSVLVDVPVTAAVLYGSHARGEATDRSDVDLAVAFDDSLSSIERTRTRLALIEQLSRVLGTDRIDLVPLSEAPDSLRREILADGIVIYGSRESLPPRDDNPASTHDDRMARFDELLTDLEGIV